MSSLTISATSSRGGHIVTVRRGDLPILTHRLDVADQDARSDFLERLRRQGGVKEDEQIGVRGELERAFGSV